MSGISLLAEQAKKTAQAEKALELVLAECDNMDRSSSRLVRGSSVRIRASIRAAMARTRA